MSHDDQPASIKKKEKTDHITDQLLLQQRKKISYLKTFFLISARTAVAKEVQWFAFEGENLWPGGNSLAPL